MNNIRAHLGWNGSYHSINREERNLTAILYHVLLLQDNLNIFLENIGCPFEINPQEAGIYIEYAYLRDLWSYASGRNEDRRNFICNMLKLHNDDFLKALPIIEFNRYFGVGNCSLDQIQSPAEWSIDRFAINFQDHDEFMRVCRFKWAFKIKPDLVIHTTNNNVVCIEAKLESDEGKYPAKPSEKAEFKRRALKPVSQTSMQEYLMKDLLGLEAKYVFLVKKIRASSPTHVTLSWNDAFQGLDICQCPSFIQEWINRVCQKELR